MNKKYTMLILAVLLMTSILAGCFGSRKEKETAETTVETTQTEATTVSTEPVGAVFIGESDEEGFSADDPVPVTDATEPAQNKQETTKPAQPGKPASTTKPPQATQPGKSEETTKPAETTEPAQPVETTSPTVPEQQPTQPSKPDNGICCKYAEYMAMAPAQQQEYMMSFASADAFVEWIKGAQAEHDAHAEENVVVGGEINIGDYMN